MLYRYETHAHTAETSLCGKWSAADMVGQYYRSGYAGICVTDHLHPRFLASVAHNGNWQVCMDRFVRGYHAARQAGEALGMDILFGFELCFEEDLQKEYLVYGADEAWLRAHPWLCRMNPRTFFEAYGDRLLIIQAHPFRDNGEVFTEYIHGIEAVNRHPRSENRNHLSQALGRANPALFRLCGSDAHRFGDEARAALLSPERITSTFRLAERIRSRDYRLWHNEWERAGTECTPDSICALQK